MGHERGVNAAKVIGHPASEKASHTPGPWTPCDRTVIVTAETHGYSTHVVDCAVGGANGKEQAANARLVAAAPDMLAALRAAQEHVGLVRLQTGFDINVIRNQVSAAIAKAEGR